MQVFISKGAHGGHYCSEFLLGGFRLLSQGWGSDRHDSLQSYFRLAFYNLARVWPFVSLVMVCNCSASICTNMRLSLTKPDICTVLSRFAYWTAENNKVGSLYDELRKVAETWCVYPGLKFETNQLILFEVISVAWKVASLSQTYEVPGTFIAFFPILENNCWLHSCCTLLRQKVVYNSSGHDFLDGIGQK